MTEPGRRPGPFPARQSRALPLLLAEGEPSRSLLSASELSEMAFDHEKMDVYQAALRFIAFAFPILGSLPKGTSHLSDQLHRAAVSIALNIAEGAGKYSRPDKRRYYLSSLGSAAECSAIFDILFIAKFVSEHEREEGKAALGSIAAMLTRLACSMESER